MWKLLYKEYKPDTATRKVGLLERVMDDQPTHGEDFGDWFLKWLDLVGECEQARGRTIDDDIKVAPGFENKFPVIVMRGLVQHWWR